MNIIRESLAVVKELYTKFLLQSVWSVSIISNVLKLLRIHLLLTIIKVIQDFDYFQKPFDFKLHHWEFKKKTQHFVKENFIFYYNFHPSTHKIDIRVFDIKLVRLLLVYHREIVFNVKLFSALIQYMCMIITKSLALGNF